LIRFLSRRVDLARQGMQAMFSSFFNSASGSGSSGGNAAGYQPPSAQPAGDVNRSNYISV
jgi:hypothetical protein